MRRWRQLGRSAWGRRAQRTMPPISRRSASGALPLSFAQQRLWFLAQLEGASEAYHIPERCGCRGVLDRGALRAGAGSDRGAPRGLAHDVCAWSRAAGAADCARGDRLRAAGAGSAGSGGCARRSCAQSSAAGERGGRSIWSAGPLIRGRLMRLGEEEHVLLVTMHHIVSDGWSMGILMQGAERAVRGVSRRGGRIRCRRWRSSMRTMRSGSGTGWQGRCCRSRRSTGRRQLAGAPALLELPTDHARPAEQDYRGGSVGLGWMRS